MLSSAAKKQNTAVIYIPPITILYKMEAVGRPQMLTNTWNVNKILGVVNANAEILLVTICEFQCPRRSKIVREEKGLVTIIAVTEWIHDSMEMNPVKSASF